MARPRLQHTAIIVPHGSQEAIRSFYGELLGLEEKQPPKALAHLQLVWFSAGENELELHFSPDAHVPGGTDRRHICLAVDDLEDYRARLGRAGIEIMADVPIPGRPRFVCRDPFGNLLELTTIENDYRQIEQ